MSKVAILSSDQIEHKLKRMAYEIWENNSTLKEITIVGIEQGGTVVARNLVQLLETISPLKVHFVTLTINKNNPLQVALDAGPELIKAKAIMLIDDVANSGKTLIYAIKLLLDMEPGNIQVAVLVDRKHKNYPIAPDIIGHSVSTTLQDAIQVTYEKDKITGAFLE